MGFHEESFQSQQFDSGSRGSCSYSDAENKMLQTFLSGFPHAALPLDDPM